MPLIEGLLITNPDHDNSELNDFMTERQLGMVAAFSEGSSWELPRIIAGGTKYAGIEEVKAYLEEQLVKTESKT